MPVYRFRLESPDGEYRQGATEAPDEESARAYLEQREEKYVFYRLDTEELQNAEAAAAAAEESGGAAPPRERARLAIHNQTEPYELVSLEEIGGESEEEGE